MTMRDDWRAIEDVLNQASDGASEPLYSQSESAKASLYRICDELLNARAVTAMLLSKHEVGLLIDGVAAMVDRTHQEAAPLLARL